MPKIPRSVDDDEMLPDPPPDEGDDSSWSGDQKEHGYYYDDAHGYETYNETDDKADDEKQAEDAD